MYDRRVSHVSPLSFRSLCSAGDRADDAVFCEVPTSYPDALVSQILARLENDVEQDLTMRYVLKWPSEKCM